VTTRSKLIRRVLQTWDDSAEGQSYLGWLIDLPSELDGGDVLREAVLSISEVPDVSDAQRLHAAIDEFCASLPPDKAEATRRATAEIEEAKSQFDQAVRDRVESFQKLRHERGCGRLEVLELFGKLSDIVNELDPSWEQIRAIEESSARMAALRRTTIGAPEIGQELGTGIPDAQRDLIGDNQVGEQLDRYYSYQVTDRLEHIVERASTLDAVQLKVTSAAVRDLFREAHEAYLYGFDVACIGLCRSLVEHALKDKLAIQAGDRLGLGQLIELAERGGVLHGAELKSARNVQRAGDDVMHKYHSLRRTAQEVLDCTRIVLDVLYAGSRHSAEG